MVVEYGTPGNGTPGNGIKQVRQEYNRCIYILLHVATAVLFFCAIISKSIR